MKSNRGSFVISLDFELMWGVRDEVSKHTYGEHIKGVHIALPKLIKCFEEYRIAATFATVGFLFCRDKEEITHYIPPVLPDYTDKNLSPYHNYLAKEIGDNEHDDPYNFGFNLVELLKGSPEQEIATHTFSHYYCLEPGQAEASFEADLDAAILVAADKGIQVKSIIFPRNQVNKKYLDICWKKGIIAYRHNEKSWIYRARNAKEESLFRRSIRLMDAYINITGHNCYTEDEICLSRPFNVASSRFLRPYSKRLKSIEWLRLRRIKKSMTYAAKNNLTYHLWWHPHNFGINQDENFLFLEHILQHYKELHTKYSFTSITMKDLAQRLYESRK